MSTGSRSHELLPIELCEHIIDNLKGDEKSLRACSLVCHRFLFISRRLLFERVELRHGNAERFYEILGPNHFPVSCFVRNLVLFNFITLQSASSLHVTLKFITELEMFFTCPFSFDDIAEWITSLPQLQKFSLREFVAGPTPTPGP